MITGNGTMETALTAIRLGAYDFLAKPCRLAEVEVLVRRASERRMLARANAALQTRLSHVDPVSELITEDPRMLEAMAMGKPLVVSDLPALVEQVSTTVRLWAQLVFSAPVVLWGAWPFHRAAWVNLRHGEAAMDTLIILIVLVAFGAATSPWTALAWIPLLIASRPGRAPLT